MSTMPDPAILRRFTEPDEVRLLKKGKFEIVRIGSATMGRATYEPGWRWSEHMRPIAGTDSCQVTHFTYVVSGRFRTVMNDGRVDELGPGDIAITAPGHDAMVVGDEPCVLLDIQDASRNV